MKKDLNSRSGPFSSTQGVFGRFAHSGRSKWQPQPVCSSFLPEHPHSAGQPIHFAPLFFALIIYATEQPIKAAKITSTITLTIIPPFLFKHQAADKAHPPRPLPDSFIISLMQRHADCIPQKILYPTFGFSK